MSRWQVWRDGARGYTVWEISPHTGSKIGFPTWCKSKREALALIRKLNRIAGGGT